MDNKERDTLIEGFRLLGEKGLEAREALQDAINRGEISATDAGEAVAQAEELDIPE